MFVYSLPRSVPAASQRSSAARQFNRAIERLFDDSTERLLGSAGRDSTVRTPALDVAENDTTYTVVLEVPGVSREQLKVTIEGRRLHVETLAAAADAPAADAPATATAETEKAAAKDADRVLYRERAAARYARTVSLPAEVDQVASQAKVENGLLTLTLVKKVPTGALQISIS